MKREALRVYACPACGAGLRLEAAVWEGAEAMSGELCCDACGVRYAIVGGVPRFVRSGEYASSFGRQWRWFREVQLDSRNGRRESAETLLGTTGWTPDDYRGRAVLDAGVGAGRFAEVVAAQGGEIFGIDLTEAVDAAFANIGRDANVHLAQADIFAMPFRDASFDLAYSIGVLHHTPTPRAAFERMAQKVKPGGGLAVYLYHGYGPAKRFSDAWRVVTTRLPLPLMLALSALAVPLYYLYRLPLLGKVLNIVLPISLHADRRWRWLDTFDWYTPRYQWKFLYPEVHRWFRSSGFEDVVVFDDPIRMRGTKVR